ncbi:hypothetical protein GCK72_016165 [Caenorhabditis remanei]|uniref:Protein XRP2 n=1 Tax=Caenorhabditis remanei TaxID=31234 RepID=A0A6A5GW37_CAERE|nr:hypothetical protein GCK72_016165 [Caenorhabditis remanei]KAF1759698.1 hypothetical protein GCK72_016165 [Caenorhabditis remanei]
MSCCFSKKLFNRGANRREDCYRVKETGEAKPEDGEAPKYSWDRREKVDPADFTVQDIHSKTLRKEGKEGGPLQIENCTASDKSGDATILFLHQTSQVIIDDCRRCTIVLGPTQGSVFVRDSSNCTILTSCQQLRTRDCTSVRIGILCPTEPIIENSNDICFFHLAMKYPHLKDQMHAVGLRPFTNRVVSVHDFSPAVGKPNFVVSAEPLKMSEGQDEILKVNTVILKATPADFIPRFTAMKDEDPTYLYILGKSEPVDELGDRAIEILHAVYKAGMKVMATYDVETKNLDATLIPFARMSERLILFQLSGSLANLECDVDFDLISENDMEPLQKLLIHLNGRKSG